MAWITIGNKDTVINCKEGDLLLAEDDNQWEWFCNDCATSSYGWDTEIECIEGLQDHWEKMQSYKPDPDTGRMQLIMKRNHHQQ